MELERRSLGIIMRRKLVSLLFAFAAVLGLSTAAKADVINTAVLCYHDVNTNPFTWSEYVISPEEMEADIQYFLENGYKFLMPKQMWYADADEKNIVLTFDDGYEGMYTEVYPLLVKYNVPAAMYVIGSEIDKAGYLQSWQIKEMDESGLVEIGNHTTIMHTYQYTVNDFASSIRLVDDFIADVKDCSRRIIEITGHGTESLAYPSGRYTALMDRVIHENLGYTTTFSTNYGLVWQRSDVGGAMNRVYRNHGMTPEDVENMINKLKWQ